MILLRVKQFLNIIFTEGDFMRYYSALTDFEYIDVLEVGK